MEDLPTPEEMGAILSGLTRKLREIADSLDNTPLTDPNMTPEMLMTVVELAGEIPQIEAKVNEALRVLGQPPLS